MSNKNYPRCKFNIDGRIGTVKSEADEEYFQGPEWVDSPADVPPPPAKPAEGCSNCLALVADAEAKFAKFDQAWAELTEANRKLLEENAALRAQLADKSTKRK